MPSCHFEFSAPYFTTSHRNVCIPGAAYVPPCVGMCQPLLPHPGTRLPHGRCSGNICWVCVHASPLSSPFPNSWKDGWPRKTWLCVGGVPLAPHLTVNLHHRQPGAVGPDTAKPSKQRTSCGSHFEELCHMLWEKNVCLRIALEVMHIPESRGV